MKTHWDKVRAVIEKLAGQNAPIERWTEEFFAVGAIVQDPEEERREAARAVLQKISKESKREGQYDQQVLNFVRTAPDGTKEQFYDKVADIDIRDWESYMRIECAKGYQQLEKIREANDYGHERWGRKWQRRLNLIDMPPMPVREAAEQP